MRRKRTSPARRLALLAVAAGLAAALGAAGARLSRRQRVHDGPPAAHPTGSPEESTYTCKCGQEYRVTGVDRHRVYFPRGKDEPVMGNTCVNCDAPLPAGHDAAVV